jgi:hypothetical protein
MRNGLWPSLIVAGGRGPSFLSALRRRATGALTMQCDGVAAAVTEFLETLHAA